MGLRTGRPRGRPKGSRTIKDRRIAEMCLADGISPLKVMVFVMRKHFEAKRYDEAAAIARDAAPYMHSRLGNLTVRVKKPEEMTDDELAAALAAAESIAGTDGEEMGEPPSGGTAETVH